MVLPIAVEDVKREVKILKALGGHENVVQFYNSFEDDNYVYIVMEWVVGFFFKKNLWGPGLFPYYWSFHLNQKFNIGQVLFSFRLCEGGELLDRILSK